jgi:hypothetical protein
MSVIWMLGHSATCRGGAYVLSWSGRRFSLEQVVAMLEQAEISMTIARTWPNSRGHHGCHFAPPDFLAEEDSDPLVWPDGIEIRGNVLTT